MNKLIANKLHSVLIYAFIIIFIAQLIIMPSAPSSVQAKAAEAPEIHPQIIIKLKNNINSAILGGYNPLRVQTPFQRTLQSSDVVAVEPLFLLPNREVGNLDHIFLLKLAPDANIADAVSAIELSPEVDWAEPDYLAYPAAETLIDNVPNDPFYSFQWGLPRVQAPSAWDITTGLPTVTIAIIDSGIDFGHEDLSGQVWVNPGEIASNGLDDDNNGFIDDINGWDFVAEDNNPLDDNGHGTQVAGVVAAATNNTTGIAGICWNCRIMPIKVMQVSGAANYSDIAQGVLYAARKGARVINLSLGGYSDSIALHAAIQEASNTYGAVVVAGAGNDNTIAPFYPAAYSEVLAVAGTTSMDMKAANSNYGKWVDISAPGENIYTTFSGGGYGAVNGTSYAAPLVAGVAGLLRSKHPNWSHSLIELQLRHTTDPIDILNPDYEGFLGSGRVNAYAAVTTEPQAILSISGTSVNGDPAGRPDPGSTSLLEVTLYNDWFDAPEVAGTLSTTDSYVTLSQDSAVFGDIPSGESATGLPGFEFNIEAAAGYSHPIDFNLHISSGDYSIDLPLTITTRSANQNVGGPILADTVWTNDKTYIVTNNVAVMPDVMLTIEPGTVIKFNGEYNLNIAGTLIANGTEEQPIMFMANTDSVKWGQIAFADASEDAIVDEDGVRQSGNALSWVEIIDSLQGVNCNNATPYLNHVTINDAGISCSLGYTQPWIQDSFVDGDVLFSRVEELPLVGELNTDGESWSLEVAGDYAYIADGDYGLRVVNVSDPQVPIQVGQYNSPGSTRALSLSGTYIYVADGDNGLRIVDVSDPSNPSEVGFYDTPGYANGLTVLGPYVYVADGDSLRIINTSNPTNPTEVGSCAVNLAQNVVVSGEYAYIAASNSGLYVVNITNPTNPSVIGHLDTLGTSFDVAIMNNYVYIADYSSLLVVDVSDPISPVEIASYSSSSGSSTITDVTISGAYAYLIDGSDLDIVDLSTPENPIESLVVYLNKGTLSDIILSGENSYITSRNFGLMIYPLVGAKASIVRTTLGGDLSLPSYSEVYDSSIKNQAFIGANSLILNSGFSGGITTEKNTLIGNSRIENATGWAIEARGFITVSHNRIVNNADGIYLNYPSVNIAEETNIEGNLIANNGMGINTRLPGDGVAVITNNTFIGNVISILAADTDFPYILEIHDNNFAPGDGDYDIKVESRYSIQPAISANNNWWETTDETEISNRIYDFVDDMTLSLVLYSPIGTSPVQSAPAYVRSVTLAPLSPVGIETVAFEVEFSSPMDVLGPISVSGVSIDADSWKAKTDIPTARSELGVVTAKNGRIYAIGGIINPNTISSSVEEYDPLTDTWAIKANMPTVRLEFGIVAASNGRIYAMGGLDEDRMAYVPTVEEYNPETNTWTTKSNMPTARGYFGLAEAQNGRIYAFGGISNNGDCFSVEEYDPLTDVWVTKNDALSTRIGFGTVAANNGRIYIIGGQYNNIALSTVEEYDPVTDTWAVKTDMPTARSFLGVAVAANGRIYAVGGQGGMDIVEEYDPLTDAWSTKADLPVRRFQFGLAAASNGRLYAIGGSNSYDDLSRVDEYTPSDLGFMEINSSPQWVDDLHYRTSYDINSLIPRGEYRVFVQNAVGADGIEIVPNSTVTFTVDYAGGVGDDITPPSTPIVIACAGDSIDTITASWISSDADGLISFYQYAIGTAPGSIDLINWTIVDHPSFIRNGLGLTPGQPVYVSVQARNAGGIWSSIGNSGAIYPGSGLCAGGYIYLPTILR